MKSFCLVAMAGVGNITGILYCSLALGLAEAVIGGIRGYGGLVGHRLLRDHHRDHPRARPPGAEDMRSTLRIVVPVLVLAFAVVMPFWSGPYPLAVARSVLTYMALALSAAPAWADAGGRPAQVDERPRATATRSPSTALLVAAPPAPGPDRPIGPSGTASISMRLVTPIVDPNEPPAGTAVGTPAA